MRRTISLVALLLPAAAALAAQDKPDFSGRWVLEKPSQAGSDIPRALSVRQTLVRTDVRGEPMKPFFKDMAVEREFESGTYHETIPIGVVSGVTPGLGEDGSRKGPYVHRAVKWEGNALVMESSTHAGPSPDEGAWSERREVWSLDPDGRLNLAITTRSSVDESRTVTAVYRR